MATSSLSELEMCQHAQGLIESVLKQPFPSTFHDSLISGIRLCQYFSTLFADRGVRLPRTKKSRPPEFYTSNIISFLTCVASVLPEKDIFQVGDLSPGSGNMRRVAHTVICLARTAGIENNEEEWTDLASPLLNRNDSWVEVEERDVM